jgi:hypothetical protein
LRPETVVWHIENVKRTINYQPKILAKLSFKNKVHAYNPSTRETEAGESQGWGWPVKKEGDREREKLRHSQINRNWEKFSLEDLIQEGMLNLEMKEY